MFLKKKKGQKNQYSLKAVWTKVGKKDKAQKYNTQQIYEQGKEIVAYIQTEAVCAEE